MNDDMIDKLLHEMRGADCHSKVQERFMQRTLADALNEQECFIKDMTTTRKIRSGRTFKGFRLLSGLSRFMLPLGAGAVTAAGIAVGYIQPDPFASLVSYYDVSAIEGDIFEPSYGLDMMLQEE